MGRRYRRRNSLGSVVTDVVRVAARLPWWGALLVGFLAYLVISIGLGGYLEGKLAAQEGSQFYLFDSQIGSDMRRWSWAPFSLSATTSSVLMLRIPKKVLSVLLPESWGGALTKRFNKRVKCDACTSRALRGRCT